MPGRDAAAGPAWTPLIHTLLLGLNAWILISLWPWLHAASHDTPSVAWLLSPLGALAAGCVLVRRRHAAAAACLLLGVPATLLAVLVAQDEWLNQLAMPPLVQILASAALIAYGYRAAKLLAIEMPSVASTTKLHVEPLPPPAVGLPAKSRLISRVVGTALLGSVMIGVIAPALGGWEGLRAAWGEAAAEGGVLTAFVGGTLAISVLGMFVGPALRPAAHAGAQPAPNRAARVAWRLALAALGAVTYAIVGQR